MTLPVIESACMSASILAVQVSDTMNKLLSQDISDKDAVAVMEGLGCKVTYIEAPLPPR